MLRILLAAILSVIVDGGVGKGGRVLASHLGEFEHRGREQLVGGELAVDQPLFVGIAGERLDLFGKGGGKQQRLRDAAIRLNGSSPSAIAQGMMLAAEEWAGTAEQADDMTVIVARLN